MSTARKPRTAAKLGQLKIGRPASGATQPADQKKSGDLTGVLARLRDQPDDAANGTAVPALRLVPPSPPLAEAPVAPAAARDEAPPAPEPPAPEPPALELAAEPVAEPVAEAVAAPEPEAAAAVAEAMPEVAPPAEAEAATPEAPPIPEPPIAEVAAADAVATEAAVEAPVIAMAPVPEPAVPEFPVDEPSAEDLIADEPFGAEPLGEWEDEITATESEAAAEDDVPFPPAPEGAAAAEIAAPPGAQPAAATEPLIASTFDGDSLVYPPELPASAPPAPAALVAEPEEEKALPAADADIVPTDTAVAMDAAPPTAVPAASHAPTPTPAEVPAAANFVAPTVVPFPVQTPAAAPAPAPAPAAAPAADDDADRRATIQPDIYAYWLALKNGRRFPAVADLDQGRISGFWPNSLLLTCDSGPRPKGADVRFMKAVKLGHPRRADDPLHDINFTSMVTEWILTNGRNAVREASPLEGIDVFPARTGLVSYRVVVLPLSDDGSQIDHILCHVSLKA